jgi:hypothetical protein
MGPFRFRSFVSTQQKPAGGLERRTAQIASVRYDKVFDF